MEVCIFPKFGYCKNRDMCFRKHFHETCNRIGCDGKDCDARHPKTCRNFARTQSCMFGSDCAYKHEVGEGDNHNLSVRDELASHREVLQERVERLEQQLRVLEVEEKQLEKRSKEDMTLAMERFIRRLVFTLHPVMKRVEALESHTRLLRGISMPDALKGRLNSIWCGDCGAPWEHRYSEEGEECNGEVCICGLWCEEFKGANPLPTRPSFSWAGCEYPKLYFKLGGRPGSW